MVGIEGVEILKITAQHIQKHQHSTIVRPYFHHHETDSFREVLDLKMNYTITYKKILRNTKCVLDFSWRALGLGNLKKYIFIRNTYMYIKFSWIFYLIGSCSPKIRLCEYLSKWSDWEQAWSSRTLLCRAIPTARITLSSLTNWVYCFLVSNVYSALFSEVSPFQFFQFHHSSDLQNQAKI